MVGGHWTYRYDTLEHKTQNEGDGKHVGYTVNTLKGFSSSGRAPMRPVMCDGGLRKSKPSVSTKW